MSVRSPRLRLLGIIPLLAPRLCPPTGPQTSAEAICGGKVVLGLQKAGIDLEVVSFDQTGARLDSSSFWTGIERCTLRLPDRSSGPMPLRLFKAVKHGVRHWIEWVDQAVSYAKVAHRKKAFDAIYSRSLPAAAHLAGYRLARYLRLPWIANMNDPWGPSITPSCEDKASRWDHLSTLFWLRRTLRSADLVTYPSERLGMLHRRISGIDRRMEVVPHIGYRSARLADRDLFVLTHAGSLVSGRSGQVLLRAFIEFLAEIPDARQFSRLVFVGQIDDASKQHIAENAVGELVDCTGSVSYERSLDHIAGSSALVLIEKPYEEGVFLPSKLCDYFAASKPVLALSPVKGVVSDLAANYRGFIVAHPEDKETIRKSLVLLFKSWRNNRLNDFTPDPRLADLVDSDVLTEKLIRAMESVCRQPS